MTITSKIESNFPAEILTDFKGVFVVLVYELYQSNSGLEST